MQTRLELLESAASAGEVLFATYAGGRAPGHKRPIIVRSVDAERDEMTVLEFGQVRTYRISHTTLVAENADLPLMTEESGRAVVVDPIEYFQGWAYEILIRADAPKPSFEMCPALGVVSRYVIDKDPTAKARADAMARGMTKAEATKHVKIMRREVIVNDPPAYDFHPGDTFYRGRFGGQDWALVGDVENTTSGVFIEAHFPKRDGRIAFRITAAEFADCLRTGVQPSDRKRISQSKRTSLLLIQD